MNFKERLHEAGTKFDGRPGELPGHVTNGSLEAQMELVMELLREIKAEFRTAGEFGEFDNDEKADIYPETIAINILKDTVRKHGIDL